MRIRQGINAITIASLLASSVLAAPAAAQQRVVVGNAASVVGDVTLENEQQRRPVEVRRLQRIALGDLIETKRNSQLQILLLDRSNFGIGQRSQVRIDEYVYDPDEGRSFIATFLKGALRFFSGADEGTNSGEIVTPSGRIGIRGTAIDMLVGDKAEEIAEDEEFVGRVSSKSKEATLVVLRGPGVDALSGLAPGLAEVTGAGVTVVLDEPGLAAYIPREGAAPIGPFRISNGGLAQVQDQISPRWARSFSDGGIPDEAIAGAAAAALIGILIATGGNDDDANSGTTGSTNPNTNTATNPNGNNSTSSNQQCEDQFGRPIPCPGID